jgi:predicted nucleic acid-binding protein
MGVFLDTSVIVAERNGKDLNHKRATALLEEALKGRHGVTYTSDYVIDEAVTAALARTRDFRIAVNTGLMVIDSPRIEKLYTAEDEFRAEWEMFRRLGRKPMSFTDCVSLVHMRRHGVEKIMSFDSGFEGLAVRLH